MPETAYIPDPKPVPQQFLGNRHFPEGYPYDDLVSRRVNIRTAVAITVPTLISPANSRKVGVLVRNNSGSNLYFGPDASVGTTIQTGFELSGANTNSGWLFFRTAAAIWANSSGVAMDIIEYFR